MAEPRVTIIVAPRERFSLAERALAQIYQQTTVPFRLVYVSGGAPPSVREYLERESTRRGFEFLHADHYVSPNQARNLGLSAVRTPYVVFLDNDALVTRGWLEALLKCAEDTGAWVVGPLYLIGEFKRATIHMAGGRLRMEEQDGKRVLCDEQYLYDTPISEATMRLRRRSCEYVEFHCMLARTEIFKRIGPLDEALLSLHEERDFCLTVLRAGGSVYIEPGAVVTYVPPPPCDWSDLPYFMLRWSESWTLRSVRHFNKKWDIASVRHVSDTTRSHEEGTVVGFTRAWRRRITGTKLDGSVDGDEGFKRPLEQAQLMIAMFQSVDREYFDFALTSGEGRIVESATALSPPEILQRLPYYMQRGEEQNLNVMVRPVDQGRDYEPVLLRLDDLNAEEKDRLKESFFLILETAPDRYQCWLAMDKNQWRSAFPSARHGGPPGAPKQTDHFVRLAGSVSVGAEFREMDGRYPRVRLIEGVVGHLAAPKQLEGHDIDCFAGPAYGVEEESRHE